jgi:hypothetical protein
MKNENCTLYDLEYGKKTDHRGKYDTHTVGRSIWRETLKNVENEKCTQYELEYGEKTDHQGKRKTHIVGPGIWQEN